MTPEALRESALSGAGPVFRGETLAVGIEHFAILENALHPVARPKFDGITIDEASELIFLLAAPWEKVFAAANSQDGAFSEFDPLTWKMGVLEWGRSLEPRITLDEITTFREWAKILHGQIRASLFKSIDSKSESPPDSASGN